VGISKRGKKAPLKKPIDREIPSRKYLRDRESAFAKGKNERVTSFNRLRFDTAFDLTDRHDEALTKKSRRVERNIVVSSTADGTIAARAPLSPSQFPPRNTMTKLTGKVRRSRRGAKRTAP
jgi:hypothetical protein